MGFLFSCFLLQYRRQISDCLFATLRAALVLEALNQTLLVSVSVASEERSLLYILRLALSTLLIAAVMAKS
jgi:hypothetical protein